MLGNRAVVLGASMAGLVAARVLADFYRIVVVVDRDPLPDESTHRRGVPQDRHLHALLARGGQLLGELFPGLLDELRAAGAPVWDDGNLCKLDLSFGGHRLVRAGQVNDRHALAFYFATRPSLECHVRRRVRDMANVTFLERHEVLGLTTDPQRSRVTGIRTGSRDRGGDTTMSADLVVDATGRGSRMPAFLQDLGYDRPPQEEVVVRLVYVSQLLRMPPGLLPEHLVAVFPEPGRHTMMTLCRCENGTAMFNVGGMLGEEPPTDLAGMIAFAEQFGPPSAVAAVRGAQPIGDTDRYCVPSNRWRRYDKVRRFPEGLLVFGDAICSFNPIYGQGMTVAALDAVALRGCLRRGERGLAHRFFRESAKVVGVAWQMAVGSDLALPEVKGHRSAMIRGSNFYTDRVLAAAECDPFVAESFLKAICFVDPPSALLRPSMLMHVATAQRRNSRSHTIDAAVQPPLAAGSDIN